MTRRCLCRPILLLILASGQCLFPAVLPQTLLFADQDQQKNPALPAEKPAENPDLRKLQDLLRELFTPNNQNGVPRINPRTPLEPQGDETDSNHVRDPIENRAPRDAKVEQLLQTADSAAQQKNWKSALDLYQRLLDQREDSLSRSPSGRWQSIRQTVNQRIGQLPESILTEYRSQYGGLARQQLAVAQHSGQMADFANVAARFFHTPAGYEAANYLGARHFDRSEYGLAARWFSDLAASPASFARQDTWLLQAALALSKAGDASGASALLNRLSQGPSTTIALGSGTVTASEWLLQMQMEKPSSGNLLVDWTQLYGTAARLGTAVGGDAFLSPNWSIPLTSSQYIRNLVKWIMHDLQDQQRTLILAAQPLVIEGRVIYRDLRGLRSVDINTGHLVWEGLEGVSPERILGGLPSQQVDPQDARRIPTNPIYNQNESAGQSAEYGPLTSLLFRDGTYGLISSNSRHVFVIEDHGILSNKQPGQQWGWDGHAEPQDLFGVPWKTNRLVAYDIHTGRVSWSLGGADSREAFDLPLAGYYFYGTPAVDGDELFVVAGKGDDIRLWSIGSQSGAPLWSQRIAYSDTKIDLDIVRRWYTSQVAVGGGVIICPTTVGWLIAVDRMRQSVLWAYRYAPQVAAPQPEREAGTQLLQQRELNALWCPSAPIISGPYVVYTPQDEPLLICLNVSDGRRIWEKPKESGVYLAGVFNQKVVIVGETEVTAYQLTDGEIAWTLRIDDGVRVSGRGVVAERHLYLPLSHGELRTIDVGTGKVLSQTYVASGQPPLGNLAMHRGKLVSLSPNGLTAFGQRAAVLTEIRQRLAKDPHDAQALLSSSELELLNRNHQEAMTLLRQISIERLTSAERTRHHAALVECLSTLIHSDILHRGAELEELKRLAATATERVLVQELTAEKQLADHNPVAAFDLFCQLADEATDEFLPRRENKHILTRRSAWLSGRLSEIWTATAEVERPAIDERIRAFIQDSSQRDAKSCQLAATLFSFHPASLTAKERLVEWLIESGDQSGARIVLEQLLDQPLKSIAARAAERLAQLMTASQLTDDAVYYYRMLETRFAEIPVRDGETGAKIVAQVRANQGLDFTVKSKGIIWKSQPLQLQHLVMNYTPPSQDISIETPLPYFDHLSLESHQSDQRLTVESVASGKIEMTVPLRSAPRVNDDGYFATSLIGHQLFFVTRGVLHALSPIERRVLWTKSLGDQYDGNSHPRPDSRLALAAMVSADQTDFYSSLLLQQSSSAGQLAVARPNYLCLHGRRSITILDPRTGSELWKVDGLPINAQVIGARDVVFVRVAGKNEALAYRVLDGKPLELPGLVKSLSSALLTDGSSLLLFEQRGKNPLEDLGLKRSRSANSVLRLYDPIARTTSWQLKFPAGTVVSPLGDREVVAVQPDWKVHRIDVETGTQVTLEIPDNGTIRPRRNAGTHEKYLLADADQIYLIINRLENDPQTFGESLPSIRVSGSLFAWNRQDNRFLWQKDIKDQNMVVDRFAKMPLLLFVSRSWRKGGAMNMNVGSLRIAAVHKQSGQLLIDTKIPAAYSAFHALGINPEEHSVDLKFYNVLLRLASAHDLAAPAEKQPIESGTP